MTTLGPQTTPYDLIGGEEPTRQLVRHFYARMAKEENALARLHELDESGQISARTQERFSLFLVEWLGGPKRFSESFGHPRLRMRHAHVKVDTAMRDAWMRAMRGAFDDVGLQGDVRGFLDRKLADLADFLRNVPESP